MAALSAEFGDDLAILAFPTGEFGGQELPTNDAIADFAGGLLNGAVAAIANDLASVIAIIRLCPISIITHFL